MQRESSPKKDWTAFFYAFGSALCFVLAFYPFGWGWLGWIAPLGALSLVNRRKLSGNHPFLQIWLACFICWLAIFQCVRLPHWAGYIGWPILSAFLCSYLFLFIVISRHLVHQWNIPLIIVAPVCWVGLEYIQAHLFTGISLGMLSHTLASYPLMIQVADLAGCYAVSFFILLIVSGLYVGILRVIPRNNWTEQFVRPSGWIIPAAWSQAILGICFLVGYGSYRLAEAESKSNIESFKIGLIQGSIDTRFPDESEASEYLNSFTKEYTRLSQEASDQGVDLVIWPESMFPVTDFYPASDNISDEDRLTIGRYQYALSAMAHLVTNSGKIEVEGGQEGFRKVSDSVPIISGAGSVPLGGESKFFNSAIQIDKKGVVVSRYGKMKLVLFGEFVPLGEVLPWLYNFFPIPPGLKAGDSPTAMQVGDFLFSPSICFESTYPHLIRENFLKLESSNQRPDVLVNVTNDGWFYGSTALDLHFANNIFRAIENRTPMLIAANTGFSGQIDSAGRIVAKGPRRSSQVVFVDLITSTQTSIYHQIGDWPAFFCFVLVLVVFFQQIFVPRLSQKLQLNVPVNGDEKSGPNEES